VKPFKSEQLFTAIEMALHKLASTSMTNSAPQPSNALLIKNAIFIKDKFKYTKIVIADILWIKSEGNYLEVHTVNREEIIRASMNNFMERLDHKDFFRTPKSYMVNLNYMTHFETSNITIVDTKIPISKSYIDELVKRINIIYLGISI
jgi:DNA-binding LytR/AlgR family response regulator